MMIDPELPAIKIVRHSQAKRLKLTVSIQGIRLTLPLAVTNKQCVEFLEQNKNWIKQNWQKQQLRSQQIQDQQKLPTSLKLNYLDRQIEIDYQDLGKKLFIFDLKQFRLIVNQVFAAYALTQFVIQQAQQLLSPQLYNYATQHQLIVNDIRIATPNSRWGSCNHQQRIMLHAGLLLMPQDYANYVILHELAHTRYMHHQVEFWSFLQTMCSQAKEIQYRVKRFRLPDWWQVKLSR